MITTTLNKIRDHSPCTESWEKVLKYLGKIRPDDEPLPLTTVLDSNGLDDTLWCLRTLPEYNNLWRLYVVWCARQVQHLMTDQRSIDALDVAERYARGEATSDELTIARDAARAASDAIDARAAIDAIDARAASDAIDARAASDAIDARAARATAWAARAARDAARDAARVACDDASDAIGARAARAARATAWAARVASDAASDTIDASAARAVQAEKLREILTTERWPDET